MQTLFQYAIFIVDEENETAKILIEPTTILASSFEKAQMKAARAIPDEHIDHLDQIQVVVRPF